MYIARRRQIVVVLDPEDQRWIASVPSLPECLTEGNSPEKALANAEDAIAAWIDGASHVGMGIPPEDCLEG
jgi:predicted RNase H-like HicB family nuclease